MKWFIVWICLGPQLCTGGNGVGVSQIEFNSQKECITTLEALGDKIKKEGYTTFCAVYGNEGDPT